MEIKIIVSSEGGWVECVQEIWSTYYVPGFSNEQNITIPALVELIFWWWETDNNMIK